MRSDVLESSLRGIQRRRLRGLGVLPSLMEPMIPSGGSSVASDPSPYVANVIGASMLRLPRSASIPTPLSAAPSTAAVPMLDTPVRIIPSMRFSPDGDPLGAGAAIETAVDAADVDRAAATGTDVVVPGPSSPTPATETGFQRYKWWILGGLLSLAGLGGWAAWRSRRRR